MPPARVLLASFVMLLPAVALQLAGGSPATASAGGARAVQHHVQPAVPAQGAHVPLAPNQPAPIDWDTIAFDLQRSGSNPAETTLSTSAVPKLKLLWSASLGTYLDAAPVLAASVPVSGKVENILYTGSEHGLFEAINATTGQIVWSHQLGWELGNPPSCGQSPFGITDSAVIDRKAGAVFVVDGLDKLYAFNLATGATLAGYPVALSSETKYEHVWSGLLAYSGTIYIEIASNCDEGPYVGRLIAVSESTGHISATYAMEPKGTYGGGVWGWGGLSIDPAHKYIYLATGNALGTNTNAGLGDHVVKLDLSPIKLSADDDPTVPQGDNDFGSAPVLFTAPNCPPDFAVENKTGMLYLYEQGAVHTGPIQSIQIAGAAGSDFIGDVAWSSAAHLLYVTIPSSAAPYENGMVALKMTSTCRLALAWQAHLGPANSVLSPPTYADGVVYYGDGTGDAVYALNATTGAVLWSHSFTGPVFAEPVVVNGNLYVVSWNGTVNDFGL